MYMTAGSTLIMNDNCFVDNNLIGEGVVIAESEDSLISVERNIVTEDDGLICQFLAVQPIGGEITCIDAQGTGTCSIPVVTSAPSPSPTSAPVVAGTPIAAPAATDTPTGGEGTPTADTSSGAVSSSRWSVALLALSLFSIQGL
jgi:hypothetical protein